MYGADFDGGWFKWYVPPPPSRRRAFSLRGGVAIGFRVGIKQQTKRASRMRRSAQGRAPNVPEEKGDGWRVALGRTRARRTLASGATHHFERFRLRSTRKHTNHIRVMSKLKVPRVVSIRKQASEVHEARGVCVTIADPALSCPILPLGRRLRLYPLPLGRRWSGRTRCIAARRCSAARRGGWRPLPLGCG